MAMILTNRLFKRVEPDREARNIYIFCEGVKREFQYFEYFKKLDSRINIEVYKLHPHEDNSPLGLLNIAKKCIIKTEDNPEPKYHFIKDDEVWIVLDTDKDKDESRKPQIQIIKEECLEKDGWFLTQSNPCFEVWLYYHILSEKPKLNDSEICASWKQFVNSSINGGFDSRKHPIYIENATIHAEKNFAIKDDNPDIGSTEVFKLSKSILPLIKEKLKKVLKEIEI